MTARKDVYLVGVGMGDGGTLTAAGRDAICSAQLLIGARRLLEPYSDLPCEKLDLYKTDEIVAAIRQTEASCVAVLLSGDTGFYSGATRLVAALGDLTASEAPGAPFESSRSAGSPAPSAPARALRCSPIYEEDGVHRVSKGAPGASDAPSTDGGRPEHPLPGSPSASPEAVVSVHVVPGISSLQYFFALIGENWDDAVIGSVHGREFDFVSAVRRNDKVFLLTGGSWKAHDVCARLVEAGLGDCDVVVGERLAYPEQRIVRGTAAQVAHDTFLDLAVMVVKRAACRLDAGSAADSAVAARADLVAVPRVLVAAPRSGAGKTSVVCGLLRALQRRGLAVAARKCGPDYIDPLFHEKVIGAPSSNIDLFFMEPGQARASLARAAETNDLVLIEGAMGYYDGIGTTEQASAWDVARVTQTPAVLVVDVHGQARSAAAEVLGFLQLRHPHNVAGIVLNRASEALCAQLAPVILEETGIPVLGCLPKLPPQAQFESRHLGLVTAGELQDVQERVDLIADQVEQGIDLEALLAIAYGAPALSVPVPVGAAVSKPDAASVIAVARDEAFCFYYDDTLRAFEECGARLVEFSPLHDAALPPQASGLYLGGGYPELHARQLAANAALRAEIRAAIAAGMPAIAECGGFLYLHEQLEADDGTLHDMVGAVPGRAFRTGTLGRFGYVTLEAHGESLLCAPGDTLRAHEFHYWDSEDPGDAFTARKPQSARTWECCVATPTLYAGFPHLYLPASPRAVERFVSCCAAYAVRA